MILLRPIRLAISIVLFGAFVGSSAFATGEGGGSLGSVPDVGVKQQNADKKAQDYIATLERAQKKVKDNPEMPDEERKKLDEEVARAKIEWEGAKSQLADAQQRQAAVQDGGDESHADHAEAGHGASEGSSNSKSDAAKQAAMQAAMQAAAQQASQSQQKEDSQKSEETKKAETKTEDKSAETAKKETEKKDPSSEAQIAPTDPTVVAAIQETNRQLRGDSSDTSSDKGSGESGAKKPSLTDEYNSLIADINATAIKYSEDNAKLISEITTVDKKEQVPEDAPAGEASDKVVMVDEAIDNEAQKTAAVQLGAPGSTTFRTQRGITSTAASSTLLKSTK